MERGLTADHSDADSNASPYRTQTTGCGWDANPDLVESHASALARKQPSGGNNLLRRRCIKTRCTPRLLQLRDAVWHADCRPVFAFRRPRDLCQTMRGFGEEQLRRGLPERALDDVVAPHWPDARKEPICRYAVGIAKSDEKPHTWGLARQVASNGFWVTTGPISHLYDPCVSRNLIESLRDRVPIR